MDHYFKNEHLISVYICIFNIEDARAITWPKCIFEILLHVKCLNAVMRIADFTN